MDEAAVPNWIHGVARRMVTHFEDTASIQHRGSLGAARESVVIHGFLDKYLPGHVEVVHSGEIRSVSNEVSPQQDILVVDPMTPPLYANADYQVVPIECVYCIGEVKSHLGRDELDRTWAIGAGIKRMEKKAFRAHRGSFNEASSFIEYGQHWPHFPVASFIFSYDSIKLETLAEDMYARALWTKANGGGLQHFLDAAFVLKKGFIYWGREGLLHSRPRPDSTVCIIEASEPGQVLLAMTSWLNGVLADAWMPRFDIDAYINKATIGTSVSWHKPSEVPPTIVKVDLGKNSAESPGAEDRR